MTHTHKYRIKLLNDTVSMVTIKLLLLFYQLYAGHQTKTTSGQMCIADRKLPSNQMQSMHDPATMREQFHCTTVPMTFGHRTSGRDAAPMHFGQSMMTTRQPHTGGCKHGPIGCGHLCSRSPMMKTHMHDPASQPNSSLHPRIDASTVDQHLDHSK